VKGLQAEAKVLKQSLEECSIATILVGLSSGSGPSCDSSLQPLFNITSLGCQETRDLLPQGKRKRSVSDASDRVTQTVKIEIDGRTTIIGGGRTHINWKTGVYSDDHGVQRHLTQDQLENLRYVAILFYYYLV